MTFSQLLRSLTSSFFACTSLILYLATALVAQPKDIPATDLVGGLQLSADGALLLYTTAPSGSTSATAIIKRTSDLTEAAQVSNLAGPVVLGSNGSYFAYRASDTGLVTISDIGQDRTTTIPGSTAISKLNNALVVGDDPGQLFYAAATQVGRGPIFRYNIAQATSSIVGISLGERMWFQLGRSGTAAIVSEFTGGNATCLGGSVEECVSIPEGEPSQERSLFCSRPSKSKCFDYRPWIVGSSSQGNATQHSLRVTQAFKTISRNGRKVNKHIGYKLTTLGPSRVKAKYMPINGTILAAPFGTGVSGPAASADGRYLVFISNVNRFLRGQKDLGSKKTRSKYYIKVLDLATGAILKSIPLSSDANIPNSYFDNVGPSDLLFVKPWPVISADGSTIAYPIKEAGETKVKVDRLFPAAAG